MTDFTENLCVNSSNVTADSHYTNSAFYEPANVVDGDAETFWHNWSNTGISWLKYDFIVPQAIKQYVVVGTTDVGGNVANMIRSWTFEGSNNDSTWDILDTVIGQGFSEGQIRTYLTLDNTISYRYYRLNITEANGSGWCVVGDWEMMAHVEIPQANPNRPDNMSELYNMKQNKLRGKSAEGFIRPTIAQFFTSMNFEEIDTPSEELIDLCEGGTAFGSTSSRPPSRAFDNLNTNATVDSWEYDPATSDTFIGYDFGAGNEKIITQITITSPNRITYMPLSYRIQGSNNYTVWTDLHIVSNETWSSAFETITYQFSNENAYRYVRLRITGVSNTSQVEIGEIEMMGTGGEPGEPPEVVLSNDITSTSYPHTHSTAESGRESVNLSDNLIDSTSEGWGIPWSSGSHWAQIDYGVTRRVLRFGMTHRDNYYSIFPEDFRFEGSNDESNWTTLIDAKTQPASPDKGVFQYWDIPSSDDYRYYRLVIDKVWGYPSSNWWGAVYEWEMFEEA